MRTTTPTINFYCRPSKIGKNGQSPVEVSLNVNGRKFFQTPLKCDPFLWPNKVPENIRQYVDTLRNNLVTYLNYLALNNIPLTTDTLKRVIQQGGVASYTLQNLYDDYNKLLKLRLRNKSITKPTYNKYLKVQEQFAKHFGKDRQVQSLTPAIVETFHQYLQTKYKLSSVAGLMTKLKTVIKYAIDNGYLRINPFQSIKIKKGSKDITYLTEAEINKIANLQIDNKSLADIRDTFILQCSTGLSYSDVATLLPTDIKISEDGTHYIIKNRNKTGTQYTTIVLPWGVEVLKRHNYKLRVISNQKYNLMLKTIQILANIKTTMTTHLARRSFATYLLCNKRVRVEVVSKALGHSSVTQTLSAYAKLIDTQVIDELKGAAI